MTGISFATAAGVEARMTWDEIEQDAVVAAARLRSVGAGPAVRLALVGRTSPALVVAIRAAVEAGCPFTVLPPPDVRRGGKQAVEALWRRLVPLMPVVVLCDEELVDLLACDAGSDAVVLGFHAVAGLPPADGATTGPPETVFLQHTSGSTREPRAVVVTHDNLWSNVDALARRLRLDGGVDRMQSWLPLYHDMGLIAFLLLPMRHRVDLVLSDPGYFARSPGLWLRWISELAATVTCAPQFAYSLVGRLGRVPAGADLSCLRLALNGAEPVDPDGVRRFLGAARPNGLPANVMACGYGLAEATLAVTCVEPGSGLRTDVVARSALADERRARPAVPDTSPVELAVLGQPLAGVDVRVVDAAGRPRGEREVGEVQVRGPSVTPGYWPVPPERVPGRWLGTGDLGYLVEGGELVVSGRLKDVIIVGGRNYSPVEVERAAARVEGVRDGRVLAFGVERAECGTEGVVVVAEARKADAALRRDIESAVTAAVGLAPAEVVLVRRGAAPRTTSGKPRRSACRQLFLDGELDVLT